MSAATAPPPAAEPSARRPPTRSAPTRKRWWTDVKGGELGSLPIVVGLIIIAIVFQTQNDRFLTAGNFVNLIVQTAPYAVIAMGVTFALLLGEIDLSIGFVSGVGGVLTAILLTPDGNELADADRDADRARRPASAIGTFHGLIITKVGVPSFVVTLAGLLAWNGVVLLLIGSKGTVILQNDFVIGLANDFLPDGTAWILMIVVAALYAVIQLASLRSRKAAGLATDPPVIVALRIGALALALAVVVALCNQDRGVPYVALVVGALFVFWTFVLNRTKFGRHIYAVGGNAEAARRAGINVDNVRIAVLRDRVDHGRAGRHHPRLAPAVGGHEHGRRPGAAVPDRRGGHRRHLAVRRARHDEGRAARRAGHARHRQRARAARPVVGHEVRAHRRRAAARGHRRLDLQEGARGVGQSMSGGASSPRPTSTGSSSRAPRGPTRRRSWPSPRGTARARRRSRASTGSSAPTAPTRRCSRTRRSTRSTSRCPTRMHVPWSVRALEAGKHVLCEKPLTRRAAEAEEAFAAAERAGRVLEEAFMWRHHPQTHRLRELLDEGVIGRLRLVQASFSFPLTDVGDIRMQAGARRRLADGRRLLLPERRAAGGGRRARARVTASR